MSSDELESPGGAQSAPAATPPAGASELSDERTLRYSPADQKTIQQPPNTVQGPAKAGQRGSSMPPVPASKTISSSLTGEMGPATLAPGLNLQDLSAERLLLSAPRTDSHGRQCPTLNGIPLLAKIGQGGMGAVYYGIHPRLRSEVAVKVLPFQLAEQDPGTIRRFFREAQLAATVHSPHLVNVTDVNEEAGLFFLVMEYVSGRSAGQHLKAVLEKGAVGLSELDALDLTIAATEGLWAAHNNNIVHRDIKPDNIMIPFLSRSTKELDLQHAKLMDLGLARNEDSQQSLTGNQSAMGTPGYMAPEQAMDAKSADKRSDVFSMGATLYALLCGHSPFKGETVMKVLMATMHEPHVPILVARADVSPAVNDLLEKCLAKKQSSRYSDARQLLGALQDCRRLLTAGGGGGESSPGGGSTLVYGGAKAGAKTLAPASAPGSSVERTAVGMAPAPQPSAAGPRPKPKKALVLVSVVVGAALVISAGVYFFAGHGKGPTPEPVPATDVQKLLAEVDGDLDKYLVDAADSQLKEVKRLYPDEPGIEPRRQRIEGVRGDLSYVVENLGLARQAIKQAKDAGDPGPLSRALPKIRVAEALTGKHPHPDVLAVRQEYEKAKQDLSVKEAQTDKLKEFEGLLADVGNLLTAGENLGDAESKLNRATKMFPDDKRIQPLLTDLKQRKEEKSALRLAGIAVEAGDLPEAEAQLGKARKLYPDDPQVLAIQDKLEIKQKAIKAEDQKRRENFQGLITEASTLIDDSKLEQAEKKITEAEKLFAKDPAIAATREKLSKKQTDTERKAAEGKRRSDAIADLAKVIESDKLIEAKTQLEAAEANYPQNKEIAALRATYEKKKQQADEQTKRTEFDDILASVDDMFKKENADLFEIETALEQAKQLIPNDPELVAREQKLKDRKADALQQEEQKRKLARFEDLLKKVQEILGKPDGSLDEAQAKLDSAKELFPDDAKLKQLLQDVDSKHKDKIVQEITAALAKNDLEGAGRQLAEAQLSYPGAYLDKVKGEIEQKKKDATAKAAAQQERDKALIKLTAALEPTGDLAEAQKLLEAFKTKHPNDAELPALDVKLQKRLADNAALQRKQKDFNEQVALADAAAKKGDFPGAESFLVTAKGILSDPPALAILDTKRTEYNRLRTEVSGEAATAAVAKVVDALKRSPDDLNAALKPAQDANLAFPANKDVKAILVTLHGMQTVEDSIKETAARASQKITEFKKRVQVAGENDVVGEKDLADLTAARGRLLGLVPAAARQLAASSFEDSAAVLQGLEESRRKTAAEIDRLIDKLGVAAIPDTKPPKQPERKKKGGGGTAGELDVFDQ